MDLLTNLKIVDPEIQKAIDQELSRQREKLEMIASENIVSTAVMQAQGSILTNKYAEGYPGKRYYGGCEYVDIVEQLAIDRAKKLFGAEYANVQPHSGAQANTAVYFALLQPGDTILGMNLTDGGHLTHGSPVNISGKYFKIIPYGVDKETERIDYDELERLAKEHQPKLIVGGASAYSRVIDFERMAQIAKSVGAYFMVDMAHIAGLVAAGLHPSPVPYADVVTTTTHKTLRGPRGGLILYRLCMMGIPMGLQYSITAIGSVVIQTAINSLGSIAVASVTAGQKIGMFFCCPFDALGGTMATYAGQNAGAGKTDRIRQGSSFCNLHWKHLLGSGLHCPDPIRRCDPTALCRCFGDSCNSSGSPVFNL